MSLGPLEIHVLSKVYVHSWDFFFFLSELSEDKGIGNWHNDAHGILWGI